MNRKNFALFFLVSLMLLLALPAAAFEHKNSCNGHWTRWQNSSRTLNVSTHVSQFWTTAWQYSVGAAAGGWNQQAPGNNFRINYDWSLANPAGVSGDGEDDLKIWENGPWPYPGYVAMTLHRKSDCDSWNPFDVNHYTEVDVLLPGEANGWNKSTLPVPSDTMLNTTLILLREYGALMGLGWENDVLATMNTGTPGPMGGPIGNNNEVHPLPDDVRGSRNAYGTSGTARDVAASVVRRTGAGTSGVIPAPASTHRNTATSFQFTVHNRGTNDETIPVYFYLAPTRWAATGYGYYLGSTTISLQQGRSTTGTAYVTIPADAPTGYQYIGWVTDPYNSIPSETNEDNNGVAMVSPTYVNSNRVPNACFNANPTSGYSPLNVSFNAGCSTDADGDALTYSWDFGDGGTATGTSPSYTFYFPGYFQVTLTVTDPSGTFAQTYRYISVACREGGFCPEEPQ